jgi:hypothetical protein
MIVKGFSFPISITENEAENQEQKFRTALQDNKTYKQLQNTPFKAE